MTAAEWEPASYRARVGEWSLTVHRSYDDQWLPVLVGALTLDPRGLSLDYLPTREAAMVAAEDYAATHCADGRCDGSGVFEVSDFTGPGYELCGCKAADAVDPAVIARLEPVVMDAVQSRLLFDAGGAL